MIKGIESHFVKVTEVKKCVLLTSGLTLKQVLQLPDTQA